MGLRKADESSASGLSLHGIFFEGAPQNSGI